MRFHANFALLSPEAQEETISAFYAARAMLYLFRFRDPGDHRVLNSPLLPQAGTSNPIQLTKRYSFGPAWVDRVIQAVGVVKVNGPNGQVAGTVDNVLGTFTPDAPWGNGPYSWSGTFDCWVRFASDEFDMTMETLDIATTDVELIEQRAYR